MLSSSPTDAPLDISGIGPLEPFDRNRAEAHDRAGIKGVDRRHRLRIVVDLDPPVVYFRKGVTALAKSRQQHSLRRYDGGRPRGVARFERDLLFVLGDRQRLPVWPQHVDRSDTIKGPKLHRDGNLCRLDLGVDIVGELGTPISETVSSVRQPTEITVGSAAQGLFGGRRLVLQRLQLGDFVQQIGEILIIDAGDLGAIIQIRTRGGTGNQCRR